MWQYTVAILTGGGSRRMGKPKQGVELPGGQTMVERMLEFARSVTDKIVVVGGEIAGCRCIQDHRDNRGPVAGIEALLDSDIDERYLVVGCDMPLLSHELVIPLFQYHETVVYTHHGAVIGLPIVICTSTLAACTDYLDSGSGSIKGFVAKIPHMEIPIGDDDAELLRSINTLKDLDKLAIE